MRFEYDEKLCTRCGENEPQLDSDWCTECLAEKTETLTEEEIGK